jgi:hypothetical protein
MPKINIDAKDSRIDGSYELDFEFDGDEIHLIKVHAGVRLAEMGAAIEAGDYDLIVALAKIALDRNGRDDVTLEQLMKLKLGAIQMDDTEAEKAEAKEEEALPPASAPIGAPANESKTSTSGGPLSNGSDVLPVTPLPVIGVQPSPTGSASVPETSESSHPAS